MNFIEFVKDDVLFANKTALRRLGEFMESAVGLRMVDADLHLKNIVYLPKEKKWIFMDFAKEVHVFSEYANREIFKDFGKEKLLKGVVKHNFGYELGLELRSKFKKTGLSDRANTIASFIEKKSNKANVHFYQKQINHSMCSIRYRELVLNVLGEL